MVYKSGRERMLTAMDEGLKEDFPVVIPYMSILLRDHWSEVTSLPWWALAAEDVNYKLKVTEDLLEKVPVDWVEGHLCPPRGWRMAHEVRFREGRVYLMNTRTSEEVEVFKPPIGGVKVELGEPKVRSMEDVDKLIPVIEAEKFIEEGFLDHIVGVIDRFKFEKFIYASLSSPFWSGYTFLGFQDMITSLFRNPKLVEYIMERATERSLELIKAYAKVGVDGLWIEECLASADVISLKMFRRFTIPYTERVIKYVNSLGMKSIYYFTGDVRDRLEDIVKMKPTCIALEESKKGFTVDLAWVDGVVQGRCCLLGNIDAIAILQDGDRDSMVKEVERQLKIGRRHGKFIQSIGSPVTPKTPIPKVREFIEIARKLSL